MADLIKVQYESLGFGQSAISTARGQFEDHLQTTKNAFIAMPRHGTAHTEALAKMHELNAAHEDLNNTLNMLQSAIGSHSEQVQNTDVSGARAIG